MNIGLGFDLHRVKAARSGHLLLAGVRIPASVRVEAHSDGDFVFHAVADSLCSALALGDIGERFPPGAPRTKGMNSVLILNEYLREMKVKRRRLLSCSVVVAAEKPKLGPWRERIVSSLTKALGLKRGQVGITFKSFEGIEPLASKSVACWATCLIR